MSEITKRLLSYYNNPEMVTKYVLKQAKLNKICTTQSYMTFLIQNGVDVLPER